MVSGATDINTDPGCGRIMDPDMALPDLNDTLKVLDTQISLAAPATQPWDMAHGHRLWPRLWASTWALVEMWARDINTDPW